MAETVKAVPEGMHTLTPHLVVRGGSKALDFYKRAFGAEVKGIHQTPDGRVAHAELRIGDSQFTLSDEFPAMGFKGAETVGGSPVVLNIYAENIDSLFNQAVEAGATVTRPLADQFWGDRYGHLKDPFGHNWALGQHIEDVAPEEMERRSKAAFAQLAAASQK